MAVDEQARHLLYQQLANFIGEEATVTLMQYLPPVGWADVATKSDLAHLREELRSDMAVLRSELSALLHRELATQTRTLIFSVLGALVGVGGLAVALSRLA